MHARELQSENSKYPSRKVREPMKRDAEASRRIRTEETVMALYTGGLQHDQLFTSYLSRKRFSRDSLLPFEVPSFLLIYLMAK